MLPQVLAHARRPKAQAGRRCGAGMGLCAALLAGLCSMAALTGGAGTAWAAGATLPSGLAAPEKGEGAPRATVQPLPARTGSVYDKQAEVSEKEVLAFAELLPQFRQWAATQGEKAHPAVREGKADFVYSDAAARWVMDHHWQPARFFCVMGRLAAGLALIMQDSKPAVWPKDMPKPTKAEQALVEKHLGILLKAGGHTP